MNKLLVMTFSAIAALVAFALPSHADDTSGLLPVPKMNALVDSANFVVRVGNQGLCSGTLISTKYRLILTAHHCIDFAIRTVTKDVNADGEVKQKDVEIYDDVTIEQYHYDGARTVGKTSYQTKIVGYDKNNDLGLLQIRADDIPNLLSVKVWSKDRAQFARGDAVWSFGNPLGLENSVSFGHLASTTRLFKRSDGDEVTFYQTDAGMLTFGNSGGALMYGDVLIGVPDLTVPGTPVSLSIPATSVQALLTKYGYEDVWNDNASQTHAEWQAEQDKKKKDADLSVKDLLQKLVDGKASPTGASDGYLFENGRPVYYLRAFTTDAYRDAMEKAHGCSIEGFAACVANNSQPPAPKVVKAPEPQSLMDRVVSAFWSKQ